MAVMIFLLATSALQAQTPATRGLVVENPSAERVLFQVLDLDNNNQQVFPNWVMVAPKGRKELSIGPGRYKILFKNKDNVVKSLEGVVKLFPNIQAKVGVTRSRIRRQKYFVFVRQVNGKEVEETTLRIPNF